jgi:hypothetical protein
MRSNECCILLTRNEALKAGSNTAQLVRAIKQIEEEAEAEVGGGRGCTPATGAALRKASSD